MFKTGGANYNDIAVLQVQGRDFMDNVKHNVVRYKVYMQDQTNCYVVKQHAIVDMLKWCNVMHGREVWHTEIQMN